MKQKDSTQSQFDPSFFYRNTLGVPVYLIVYVDDASVLSPCSEALQVLVDDISLKFSIKIGQPSTFVGIQIDRDLDGTIYLHQEFMIKQLLERFNMKDCNPVSVPMCPSTNSKCVESEEDGIPYRSLVGGLLFLAKTTQPDIGFAVAKLSQHNNGYDNEHWIAAKRVLRYLKETMDLSLKYLSAKSDQLIVGFSDSDYACDRADRKSQSGFVFFYGEKLISWNSQKQKVVACSTIEAEYMSLADATKESIWIHRLMSEMARNGQIELPVQMNVDNTSAIRLAKNPEFHQQSKHIDVAYHPTRQHIQSGFLQLDYVSSSEQIADGLTKPLPACTHQKMKNDFRMAHRRNSANLRVPKVSALCCALLTLMVVPLPCWSYFTSSTSVMWRPIDLPVVTGYNNVHLIVKLENPCTIFNGTVHPDLRADFYGRCLEMYDTYFLKELQEFCPSRSFSDHRTSKRFAASLGIIIATVIMSVGVGAVSVGTSIKAMSEVNDLDNELEDESRRLDAITANVNLLNDKYISLKKTVRTVNERLISLEDDHNLLKVTQFDTVYGVSFITGRFLTCQQVMRGTQRALYELIRAAFGPPQLYSTLWRILSSLACYP